MKKTDKIIIALIFIIIIMFAINSVYALNIDYFKPAGVTYENGKVVFEKTGIILSTIRNIGAIVGVIVIAIIGITYMFSSAEEKADYKKNAIPYIVGSILLLATSSILTVIQIIVAK